MKLLIKLLILAVLFGPLSTRAETYYEAAHETCYSDEEVLSLREKLQDSQVKELDLRTVEQAYKTCQARGGGCSYQWGTFGTGVLVGVIFTAVLSNIVKGGR